MPDVKFFGHGPRGAPYRAAKKKDGEGKKYVRIGRAIVYALIVSGANIVIYGMLDSSPSLVLPGISFLAMGILARSMMWVTRDISERLFDGLDKLLDGQERILDGQERILEAIRGPAKQDSDGKPVAEQDNLMSKLDELIAAVDRLAYSRR